MYMMVLQNSVKFFGDTVFNIDPDAETLADITVQMADAVQGFGVTPRVAMISYSNFGSVRHPDVTRDPPHDRASCARAAPSSRSTARCSPRSRSIPSAASRHYGFSRLTRAANTLVFPSLASGNAAYQILKVLGGASAVGPILLGVAKPVAAMQNDATVEDIVNMTAYVVLKAQQQQRKLEQKRA